MTTPCGVGVSSPKIKRIIKNYKNVSISIILLILPHSFNLFLEKT